MILNFFQTFIDNCEVLINHANIPVSQSSAQKTQDTITSLNSNNDATYSLESIQDTIPSFEIMIEANQTASNSIKNIIPQKQKIKNSSKFNTLPKSSIISARTKKVNSTKITSKNKNNMSTEKRMPKTSSSLGSKAPTAREIFLGSRAPTAREIFLGSRAPTATSLDCRVCKKYFVSVRHVRNHEKAEHADVLFPIKCNICLGGFAAPLK